MKRCKILENEFGKMAPDKRRLGLLRELADGGDAEAQCDIALMYELGLHYKQHGTMALTYYRKSAIGGNVNAKAKLGSMFYFGIFLNPDYMMARVWYKEAEVLGHLGSTVTLGWIYQYGEGVKQSYSRSRKYYEKACKKIYPETKDGLNWLYNRWRALQTKDYSFLWNKSLQKHSDEVICKWFSLSVFMDGCQRSLYVLTPGSIERSDLWDKAVNGCNAESQYKLAMCYKGQDTMWKFLKKSAEQGHARAQLELSQKLMVNYWRVYGDEEDKKRAQVLFTKSLRQGDKKARKILNDFLKRDKKNNAQVAHMAEHKIEGLGVGGSIPPLGTKFGIVMTNTIVSKEEEM